MLGIELALENPAIADAGDVERLAHLLTDAPRTADTPAHHADAGDAMIIPHVRDQLLAQRDRQRRIVRGYRQHDDRSRIGNDHQMQLRWITFEARAVRTPRLEPPRAAGARRKPALDACAVDPQMF